MREYPRERIKKLVVCLGSRKKTNNNNNIAWGIKDIHQLQYICLKDTFEGAAIHQPAFFRVLAALEAFFYISIDFLAN